MKVIVDTCVWSMSIRKKANPNSESVDALRRLLNNEDSVYLTGAILQEVLQGLKHDGQRTQVKSILTQSYPILIPGTETYIAAAKLHCLAKSNGITLGTVDALIAAQCIEADTYLLSDDKDFPRIIKFSKLKLLPKIKLL